MWIYNRALLSLVFLLTCVSAHASITINSPADGSTLASPVQLNATLSTASPTSILVYDNNSLILQERARSSITAALTLSGGAHTILVQSSGRGGTSTATSTITVSTPVVTTPTGDIGSEIAADMTGQNEGNPQGVPLSWNWAVGPVLGLGNTPPSGWTAVTAWGVIYQGATGNTSTNTRVNLRNVQLYLLSKSTGAWTMQSTSQPDGAAYEEDFSGNPIPADVRTEPDGTISVTAGMGSWSGRNFHFYPDARAAFNNNDVAGVVSIFEARLIVGDPSLPDDTATANYLAEAGADYWPSLTGLLPAILGGVTPPVGNGKFKQVETAWRFYSMTSMTAAQLDANPPPVNLAGTLP